MIQSCRLFSGTANPDLAVAVAAVLGLSTATCVVDRFPDGEVQIRLEESVRGLPVFIVQPTSPPVNEHLVELLAFVDACRRGAAGRITAVIPYFGYARSDKRRGRNEPIAASMVATLLQAVGVDHVITIDLHTPQIEGFFQVSVDSLKAAPTLIEALRHQVPLGTVVVSPDVGRVPMATEIANGLGTSVVVLHKRRSSGTETEVTHVIGDVRSRPCLLIDDMISTGGTLAKSMRALLDHGSRPEFYIAATHGLFIAGARQRLMAAGVREVLITDTISPRETDWPELRVVSIAPLIAETIRQALSDGTTSA